MERGGNEAWRRTSEGTKTKEVAGEFFQEGSFHGHGDLRIEKVRRKVGQLRRGKHPYKFMTRIYRPPSSSGKCLRLEKRIIEYIVLFLCLFDDFRNFSSVRLNCY